MNSTGQHRSWLQQARRRPLVWAGIAVVLGLAAFLTSGFFSDTVQETAYYETRRGDFLVTIVEGGTLESVNEVVIRNEVEGNSRVIYLVPEGSYVKQGDLLVELDTGEAVNQVNQQEINYEKAKAAYIQAEKDLEIQKSVIQSSIDKASLAVTFAEIDKEKFEKGQMLQELRNAEIEITTATSDLLLAKDNLEWTEKLYEQGFENKNAVDQGRNQVQDLTLRLEKSQTNLWVVQTFEHPKMLMQLQSDLEEADKELDRTKAEGASKLVQLQADLMTQSNSLDLIRVKLEKDKEQLEKSKIYAPQDGLVVYAIQRSRFSSESLIEEGAMVRNRQELIKLPDTSSMKVGINIHESHVNKVRPGQQAFVVLDSLPDQRFRAEVSKVAVLPDTQSRFGNPNLKVYKSEVLVKDPLPDIKPGVSARAEIVITNIPNALTVPIQSVTSLKGKPVVYVRRGDQNEPVPVEVGLFNTKFIEIVSGLEEGQQVLLSPPFDAKEKDLGGAIIGQEDNLPPDSLQPRVVEPEPGSNGERPRGMGPSGGQDLEQPGGSGQMRQGRGGRSAGNEDATGQRPRGQRPGFDREEMLKRFDTNGDGEIDETERQAIREEMKRRFGEGGGGPGSGPGRRPDGSSGGGRQRNRPQE